MTPKEKAEELFTKFLTASFGAMKEYIPIPRELAKQCALIAVEEMLEQLCEEYNDDMGGRQKDKWLLRRIDYWKEIKTEIEKL